MLVLAWTLATTAMPVCLAASDIRSKAVRCGEVEYQYLLFSPPSKQPLPAILLLHGAGDHPPNFIEAWKSFAKQKHIVLIAPELPRIETFERVAPAVFKCVVEDAKLQAAINPRRVYVFGHSMGGYLAYDAATFDSEYFAAVAVHAMGIADEYDSIVNQAKRKTPIAIYIGDQDELVPITRVERSRDLLRKSGFPVHYVELRDHDHNYYDLAGQINDDAWKFLSQYQLPGP
ncbi:MAG: alpha/beta fold hydrolase [Terriglobales bacterium]|jgi:predicted esterase